MQSENYQDLADRYVKVEPIAKIIEQITDHKLRAKLHLIYCEKFILDSKWKYSKPCEWQVSAARQYDPDEVLDYGNDVSLLLEVMIKYGGKIYAR